ncbi:hypothetical protein BN946_scf184721.g7 [Trametes cinnabarina]|uniref:Uncharacterized protein n=1 Tax=Pycnoporus cinnabarinus TaxID=5643 RepID=A0A060SP57_PYCCI|nr:hypothetical protein BN946_scf184721.g7 [Trametes cinnabarina]
MPRPRKTPDQVLEEKTEKDKAALEAKAKEDAAIAHVAELEKDLGEGEEMLPRLQQPQKVKFNDRSRSVFS